MSGGGVFDVHSQVREAYFWSGPEALVCRFDRRDLGSRILAVVLCLPCGGYVGLFAGLFFAIRFLFRLPSCQRG